MDNLEEGWIVIIITICFKLTNNTANQKGVRMDNLEEGRIVIIIITIRVKLLQGCPSVPPFDLLCYLYCLFMF